MCDHKREYSNIQFSNPKIPPSSFDKLKQMILQLVSRNFQGIDDHKKVVPMIRTICKVYRLNAIHWDKAQEKNSSKFEMKSNNKQLGMNIVSFSSAK